jgi:adenylosuccinate synthase
VAYEIDGVQTRDFPVPPLLKKARPVLKRFAGFGRELRGIRSYDELPQAAKDYVDFIEREIEVPVTLVSNGPKREEILERSK